MTDQQLSSLTWIIGIYWLFVFWRLGRVADAAERIQEDLHDVLEELKEAKRR